MPLIASSTLVYAYAGALLTISYFLLTSPVKLLTSAAFLLVGEAMHVKEATYQPSAARLAKGLPALSPQSIQLLGLVGVVLASNALVYLLFAAGLVVPASLTAAGPTPTSPATAAAAAAAAAPAPTSTTVSPGQDPRSGVLARDALRAQRGEELHTLVSAQSQFLNLAFVHVVVGGGLCAWIYILHSERSQLFFASSSASSSSSAFPSFPSANGGLGALLGEILANQVVFGAALVDMLAWGYLWTVIREERREVLSRVQQIKAEEDEYEKED